MSTTTILGANGKLGAILATYARVAGQHWRTQSRSGMTDITWSGDLEDPTTDDIFEDGSTLINMIGMTHGSPDDLNAMNVSFVEKLLEKAAARNVAHVILASSAAVYGAGDGQAFSETDPLHPISPYGISKVAMEQVAKALWTKNGPALTILRIGNVAGADALTTAAQRHIVIGKPMPLHRFRDGATPSRSYISPIDLFRTVRDLSMPHDKSPRIINIAHPQPVTFEALLAGYKAHILPDLTWVDTDAPDTTPRAVILGTDRLQHDTDLLETDAPADALARSVAEYFAL